MKRYDEEHTEVARSTSTSRSKRYNKKVKESEDEEDVPSRFGSGRTRNENQTKPKRPVNAFWLFASEVRDQVSAANPDLKGFKLVSVVVLDLHFFPAISNIARSHALEW